MAETESVDLMASVFENIILPQVQIQHDINHQRRDSNVSHQSSNKAPVPKQRHDIAHNHHHSNDDDVPVLEREREFRASFLGSEHLDEPPHIIERQSIRSHDAASLKSASTRRSSTTSHTKSASRRDSTISRKSEQIYDDVHSAIHEPIDDVHVELQTPTFEHHQEVIVESHTPTHEHEVLIEDHHHSPTHEHEVLIEDHHHTPTFEHHHDEEIIFEPHTPTHEHHHRHIESDQISNSSKLPKRTNNTEQLIAELRSRQINGSEADHGGTISTSKTSEIANEFELYATPIPRSEHTDVNEQTDDSGTETDEVLPVNRTKYLFDTKDPYRIEHDKQPDTFQQELGQKVIGYQRDDHNQLHHLDGSNTLRSNASAASDFIVSIFENKTQDRVRNEVGSEIKLNNLRKLFESPAPSLNGTIEDNPQQHHASYKQFLGQKSPEHRVFRSGSVVSMIPPPLIDPSKVPVEHFDQNHQLFSQYKHSYTGQKPMIPLQKAFVHKPQLNGHSHEKVHHHHHPIHHHPIQHHNHVSHVNHVKTPQESRKSTLIEHHNDHLNHHINHVKTPQESRKSTLIEHHNDHVSHVKSPQESRKSTLIENHQHEYSVPAKRVPSYQQYIKGTHEHHKHYERISEEPVHHHHQHLEHVKSPLESRRSTLIHNHENHKSPLESRRSTLIHNHENHKSPLESRRSTVIEKPVTPSYQQHVKKHEEEHIYEEIGEKVEPTHHNHHHSIHNHEDVNNNVEHIDHTPVSKLCTIFEKDYQSHHKHKHFISAPVSPAQNYHHHTENFQGLERFHIPLLSRIVISDATAHGKGSCTPGSISALHQSILAGNPIIQTRSITPMSESTSVHEEVSVVKEELPVIVEKKHQRRPKTLSEFYNRWGKLPTISSET